MTAAPVGQDGFAALAEQLWRAACYAAEHLQQVPGAAVALGAALPVEVVEALAALAEVETRRHTTIWPGREATTIIAMKATTIIAMTAYRRGVEIRAQGDRAATEAEIATADLFLGSRKATDEEREAAAKAVRP